MLRSLFGSGRALWPHPSLSFSTAFSRPFPQAVRWHTSNCADNSDAINRLITGNRAYAQRCNEHSPELLERLSIGQSPEILWIGCADSRVPETTICACQPGDIFVHRNIANMLVPGDRSSASVIDFAVGTLKVNKIVVCGHTKCGGAIACLGDGDLGENLNTWLQPVRDLRKKHQAELDGIADEDQKAIKLAELNVKNGLNTLRQNKTVIKAMEASGLTIHGFIYDIAAGQLKALKEV